jgi:hypothetical protein
MRELITFYTQQEMLAWCKKRGAHNQQITTGNVGITPWCEK